MDSDAQQHISVSYGEVRYVPARQAGAPQAAGPAAAGGRPSRVKKLDEGLLVARSTVVNAVIILLIGLGLAFTFVELRREVVVIDAIRLPTALEEMGYSDQVAAIRLWGAVARISEAARTDKDRVALLPASQQVDFEAPGAGVSVQSLMRALRSFLSLEETRIAGEFICGTPDCAPEQLSLRLRVFQGSRMEILSLDPIGEDAGTEGQGTEEGATQVLRSLGIRPGEPLTERNLKAYFHRAALDLLRMLDPFIVASFLYQNGSPNAARDEAMRLTGPGSPERKWALNLLGLIATDRGDHEAAVAWFRKAVDADPEDAFAIAYLNWGNALRAMGRPDEAIPKYRRAAELDPEDALAFNNWGAALSDKGELEAAIEKYRRATEIAPEEALAYNNWGSALFEQGEPGAAIGLYRRATELDPDYAVAYVNWGNALFVREDVAGAVEKYREAVRLDPRISSAHFNMALALRQAGRTEEAIAAFEAFLDTGPDPATAAWVETQIADMGGGAGSGAEEVADGAPEAADSETADSTTQEAATETGATAE